MEPIDSFVLFLYIFKVADLLLDLMNFSNTAAATLVPTICLAYVFQIAVGVPCVLYQEDRFYGSLTYLGGTLLSLYLPSLRARTIAQRQVLPLPDFPALDSFHPRQIIMSALTMIWTIRLGSFLFHRILKSGGDIRFAKLKKRPRQFFFFWVGQATWVSLVGLPIFALNALPSDLHPDLNWIDFLGIAIWLSGFIIENLADYQKTQWRKERDTKRHNEKWISRGLWSKSRHPNYFGECLIWTGSFIASANVLSSVPTIYPFWFGIAMVISPLFTLYILTKVSGIPPLEYQMNKQLRGNKEYEEYKGTTPILIPKLFS